MLRAPSKLPRPTTVEEETTESLLEATSAPSKRPRECDDDGDRPLKHLALVGQNEEATTFSKGGVAAPSSKLRAPIQLPYRQPLAINPTNTNITIRTKRSHSAPPKDLKPAQSGVVKGQRTNTENQTVNPLSRSGRGRLPRLDEEDPRWERFEAQLTAAANPKKSDRTRLGAEMSEERAKLSALQSAQVTLETELRATKSAELENRRGLMAANDQLEEERRRHVRQIEELDLGIKTMERDLRTQREDIRLLQNDLKMERDTTAALKEKLGQQATVQLTLQTQLETSQALARGLQGEVEKKLCSASDMQLKLEYVMKRNAELEAEAIENEMLRRKLHNQVQELKGNIRVYCRVRPALSGERDESSGLASISFPDYRDHREIVLTSSSETAMGNERKEVTTFTFDRVFEPHTSQVEIFEEVSQLIQSVTDGYNVTIFAYGQTGSGKSFTMEGGSGDAMQGMIPRAVRQVFQTGEAMRAKGWEYQMEGQFLEIYNETINDLLGQGDFDKRKHEIKHDKSGKTTVTDVVTLPLSTAAQVSTLLSRAQSRRSVASTLMNERSSRSHSVFTLRVMGTNTITGETCEGALNLVDLAGSERLSSSGAANDKDRLRETQAINKSLSALGDVIGALGAAGNNENKAAHIPYRNSKLTYLLQNSLGGNSKTLMILNLSPMAAHYGESMCSLRFATKVNNTTIGTAKKQIRSSN